MSDRGSICGMTAILTVVAFEMKKIADCIICAKRIKWEMQQNAISRYPEKRNESHFDYVKALKMNYFR